MERRMMKSKIHRATVTESNLEYEGSITIDEDLLLKANILPYEQVDIYNVTNGERFTTYAIKGEKNSGVICINGAAAHKGKKGDIIIIVAYGNYNENELSSFEPKKIYVDKQNMVKPESIKLAI
ncbi:MAG: aspartate 1-decarboxylase [Syntrophobacterales bacterium]|jgi:aspartate 1-decarboxylase|nr:aspartate 1-decarboxylase [Syntrophobacterales bacterium]